MVRNHSLAVCVLLAIAWEACGAQAAAEGHRQIGYIPLRDGTQLAYILYRPDTQGRFPVLVIYNPYWGGGTAFGPDERAYIEHGYAVLGVSARGTGCSSGIFHSMFEEPEAQDGAQVIEWAAAQPWSNGSVGMYGNSYSGVTQMMVGSLRPPHVKALAAGGTAGDLYTDVAYAGGIFNFEFMAQWTYYTQPDVSAVGVQLREAAGDRMCARHRAAQLPAGDTYIQIVTIRCATPGGNTWNGRTRWTASRRRCCWRRRGRISRPASAAPSACSSASARLSASFFPTERTAFIRPPPCAPSGSAGSTAG